MAARKSLSVSTIIKNAREDISDKRQRLALLIKHKDALNAALALVSPIGRLADDHSVNPWLWTCGTEDYVELSVTFDLKVDSLRSETLAMMLTLAGSTGFNTCETEDNIWSERSACRTYRWKGKVGYVQVQVRINANVGNATMCKITKVGTKTEERPVYELICED